MSWVRTSTAVPSNDREVLITYILDNDIRTVSGAIYGNDGMWYSYNRNRLPKQKAVIAWSDLPEPYRGEQE